MEATPTHSPALLGPPGWTLVPRTACQAQPHCLVANAGADTKVREGQRGYRSWAGKGCSILIKALHIPPRPSPRHFGLSILV